MKLRRTKGVRASFFGLLCKYRV